MDENRNKQKAKPGNLVKKQKKPPQVRQTLTSKYRMLKANPLLMHELGKKVDMNCCTNNNESFVVKPLKTLVSVLDQEMNKSCSRQMASPLQKKQQNVSKHSVSLAKIGVRKEQNDQNAQKLEFLNPPSDATTTTVGNWTKRHTGSYEKHHNVQRAAHHDKNTPKRNFFNGSSEELTNKLKEWLKRRGKSFGEYHHLKCFGVEEHTGYNKENIETNIPDRNSYDELKIKGDNEKKDQFIEDMSKVAQDALLELHKLILEGYPPEQCEIWLKLIKERHRQVEEEPQYWECRAALEQTKGNINMAVECYKTAIVQGAEVKNVDKRLDQLLQKFSLLNIDKDIEVSVNSDRSKVIQDARNIFKSSIIQFAVQERVFKKRYPEGVSIEKKLIATPVRRSTRLSRSAFTSTPGIQVYSSLQDIDNSMRDALNFHCNNALRD